jgi:SAM-dependent methyltransferase
MDPNRTKIEQYSAVELHTINSWDFFNLLGIETLRQAGTGGTRRILYELELKPGDKVLQLGGGTLDYAKYLIETYGVELYAVDYEPYMVEKAKRICEDAGIADHVHLICGDCTMLPYPDNSFDAAISESFLYATNQSAALREVFRVVKPGGALAGTEWTWNHVPPRDIRGMNCTIACGFERPGMSHFYTRQGWIDVFRGHNFHTTYMGREPFIWFSWPGLTDNEGGAWNVIKIFYRCFTRPGALSRFREITSYLAHYEGWLSTSLFVARKPTHRVFRILDQPLSAEDAQHLANDVRRFMSSPVISLQDVQR